MMENNSSSSKSMKIKMSNKQKWIIGIISSLLVAIIITLSVLFGLTITDRGRLMSDSENRYQRAYYGLVTSLVDIENELAKTRVMTGDSMLEEALEKIDVNCQISNTHLSVLATNTSSMESLSMFFNQLGGYSQYLGNNIARGNKLTTSNVETLNEMWQVSKEYGRLLNGMQSQLSAGYSFAESLGQIDDEFNMIFEGMDETSVEYPSLIFDGPFSDGVLDREPKGTVGEDLTDEQARELLPKYLYGYEIANVNSVIENNNRIPSYIYDVKLAGENTRYCTVQIAKKGGMLLMLDLFHHVEEPKLTIEQCQVLAEQYCESIGLDGMEAVWINNNNSTVYVNMCYVQDDIIIYPDMIKLKISLDTGEIVGYEGLNYAFNHVEREDADIKPAITIEDAVLNASAILEDIDARLCIIPVNVTNEVLCYELVGEFNGEKYFIYVDAKTGEELKVLRMIDSNQGDLLM